VSSQQRSVPYRRWDGPDEVLAAVRGWLEGRETARLAEYFEERWRRPHALPSVWQISRWVGEWPDVLRACGWVGPQPRFRYWTPDQILDTLQGWLLENPRARSAEYDEQSSGNPALPSSVTVVRSFGSWRAAIEAARQRQSAGPSPPSAV
jgi:hypothetical protein